jgi:hypothetical protein
VAELLGIALGCYLFVALFAVLARALGSAPDRSFWWGYGCSVAFASLSSLWNHENALMYVVLYALLGPIWAFQQQRRFARLAAAKAAAATAQ